MVDAALQRIGLFTISFTISFILSSFVPPEKVGEGQLMSRLDTKEGADIGYHPLRDTVIPTDPDLATRRPTDRLHREGSNLDASDIDRVRNLYSSVTPEEGRHIIQVVNWVRRKVKHWTGMDFETFFKAAPVLGRFPVLVLSATSRDCLIRQRLWVVTKPPRHC
jgi:hypothetical protein